MNASGSKSAVYFILLACFGLMFALTGCRGWLYSNVYRYDDEFRKSTRITGRISVNSLEPVTSVGSAGIILINEISGESSSAKAYFIVERASSSFRIDRSGFIKNGGRSFEVTVNEPSSEFKSSFETAAFSSMQADSTGIKASQMINGSTSHWIDEKFIVALPPDLISTLGTSEEITFRFYFGPEPATYRIRGRNLKTMKRVYLEN